MSSATDTASTETPSTQLTAAADHSPPAATPAPAHTLAPAEPFHALSNEVQVAFLGTLAQWGNVRAAAAQVGVSRQHLYRMRRASPEFRELWDAALVLARPQVEEVLADRALNGVQETVFYHGEEVATRTRYDSRLLLAHLGRLDRLEARGDVFRAACAFEERLEELRNPRPRYVWDDEEEGEEDFAPDVDPEIAAVDAAWALHFGPGAAADADSDAP